MYKSILNFINDYKFESENTLKLLSAIDDASLDHKINSEGRSLGRLAWHIVETLPEMMNQVGLNLNPVEDLLPQNAAEIKDMYRDYSNRLIAEIEAKWNDFILSKQVNLYGQDFLISDVLVMLVKHEIHHRAQLTVLMRSAGLQVAGMYGPSKEEWVALGMAPQE